MENEQSINDVLSQFDRDQKKARVFNTAATVVGVIATIGLIALVAAIAYKYTTAEKQLNVQVSQARTELDTRSGELQLAKTELDGKETELKRLQESVKSGSGSGELITSLQRDLTANQQKLVNANEQVNELKGLMASMQNPNEAVTTLTRQLAEKDASLTALKNQVVEKDRVIAAKDKTIADKERIIVNLTRKGGVDKTKVVTDPAVKIP